ncbi:DUF4972 domain-containing protein [Paenibacillus dakarensis]|uniref:DUF4972 domain-containing protein n=1 Tax=Paenibacillus dakarensis TaxID=1527293 RepID=UPI0006D58CC1|nr:DUF4972 domain-containing protein [Paenibacillus dakarensis]
MRKTTSFLFIMLLVISMLGCSNQSGKTAEQPPSPDDIFIEEFGKAINKRWTAQDMLDDKLSKEVYYEKNAEILEAELESIEKSLANVEDKDLKETGSQYVEGAKKQIEAFKTTDYELQITYSEESEKLRKPALIKLVEEYHVKIDEEHNQTYRDFKEQAAVINKENDANKYAETLGQEISFEKSKGEFGNITYKAIVENTSDIEFDSISYEVQYKDKDGIVVGNDSIYLENFSPGSKQKVELILAPEDTKTISISLDHVNLEQ